jgi:hypothetical protein
MIKMIIAMGISTLQRCEADVTSFEGFRELIGSKVSGGIRARISGLGNFTKKFRRQGSAAGMFSSVQDQLTCKRCWDYPSPDPGRLGAAFVLP